MEETHSWLYLAEKEFSKLRIYKRMRLDELPQLTLHSLYRYLTVTDLCRLLHCSRSMLYSVREFLEAEEVTLLENDSIRMSHERTLSLLKTAKNLNYLKLCCFNVQVVKIMPYIPTTLRVLKLQWVEESIVLKFGFWKDLMVYRDSLKKLSLRVIRRSQSPRGIPMPGINRLTVQQIKTFFSEMKSLERFAYKVKGYEDIQTQAPSFNQSVENASTIVVGLLSSDTKIKKLKFLNMTVLPMIVDNPLENESIEEIKIMYEDFPPISSLNTILNSFNLRLTSKTMLLVLRHFRAVSKITINDWSSEDDKGLSSQCIVALLEHQERTKKPMTLNISSFQWHWKIQKINLFQLCELRLKGELALRSLFSMDTDCTSMISTTSNRPWDVSGLELSYTNINDQSLEVISSMYNNISTLGISGCKKITREGLIEYLPTFKNLKEFSAEEIHTFTSTVLDKVIECNAQTLEKIKLKKNKISGQAIEKCLKKCRVLRSLTLRNMNALYDDFHFRWIDSLHSDKICCPSLIQLDISNNIRFSHYYFRKIRRIFPNLLTLKLSHTYPIGQKQSMIHPNVQNLSAEFEVSKPSHFKKVCLKTFPNLATIQTDLGMMYGLLMSSPEFNQRRILIKCTEGKTFVI